MHRPEERNRHRDKMIRMNPDRDLESGSIVLSCRNLFHLVFFHHREVGQSVRVAINYDMPNPLPYLDFFVQ
ncbi:MAG: hypothetical protein JWO38_3664 [Gemmataceae bacterium]|nr:hypothetical protein [Gemmataceae bacterium]